MMLVYFKNRHGKVTEIDVEPQETMREVVMNIEELGGIEKVWINIVKYSCSCDSDLTEILLDDISGGISINIQNDIDKSAEINLIYHELSYKQVKDIVVKEVKDESEFSKKRLKILETQLTTRIIQLESMMDSTVVKQTEQLSMELDKKNYILCKFMDNNIFKHFGNSSLQNDTVSESSRHPLDVSKIIDGRFLNSRPQCFECVTPIVIKTTSANISRKENTNIDLNKKLNDQLIKINKSRHQEYINSNCNAVIDDMNKDTRIDNYDTNKKRNSHVVVDSISLKAKAKACPRGTCLVTGDSMLNYIDETRMSRKFEVKVRSFLGAKTDDTF